jgi:hypothetical protein
MNNNHKQRVEAPEERRARYEDSMKKLNELTNYLKKCKYIEALSLKTPDNEGEKVILHVFKKGLIRGKEQIVEGDYLLGLMKDVKEYRAELAKGMLGNEKNIKDVIAGLEKSRKDLESLNFQD